MAQDKISMPSGMGGLMRYFDEYKSKIRIKPGHIIIMCVVVMIIMFVSILLASTLIISEKISKAHFRNFITPTNDFVFVLGTLVN